MRAAILRPRGDQGETLIEILISMAILGIVLTALVAGLTTSIVAGNTHRHLTDVELVARAYGEALVSQAYHPATTTLASDLTSSTMRVTNVPASGLPTAPFFVAVDGEVLRVNSMSGVGNKIWNLAAAPQDSHLAGSSVVYAALYDACVNATHLAPVGFTMPAGATNVTLPTLSATEFFSASADASGNLTATSVANCDVYWRQTLPCSKFATPEHLTICDPGVLRATITATTTGGGGQPVSTTTRVLVRRGDA